MAATVCLQCSLRAFLLGEPAPLFDEAPDAHQRRVHPDLAATRQERQLLEAELRARLARGEAPT